MKGEKILKLLFLSTWICRAEGAACTPDASTRTSNFNSWKNDGQDTTLNNNGFLTDRTDAEFDISCCGVVKAWNFIVGTYTGTPSIDLQIWRLSGTTWTLVGQNTHTLTGAIQNDVVTHNVNAADRISVKSGDAIGWYSNGPGLVTYETGGGTKYQNVASSTLVVGSVFGWGSVATSTGRTYNIEVVFDIANTPAFTNLDNSISVPDYSAVGTILYMIVYTNAESVSMAASTVFSFDATSNNVTNLQYIPDGATDLSFTATDICGNGVTNKLTISTINSVPVINSLPSYTEISEDLKIVQLLHTINVTDMSPLDTVTCSLSSPPSDFTITSNTLISIQSNPSLDYDVNRVYELTVLCTDTKDTVNSTFTVYITMNHPPVITNLWASKDVPAASTGSGATVFTVVSTDPENDTLSYNLTCSPTSCPFTIQNSGEVQTTQVLATHTVHAYDLYIYVYDGNHLVGPRTLTIVITGINDPPVITNLPLSSALSIPENTALGTSIYQVYFVDINPTDSHTFSMTSDLAEGSNLFSIDSSGVISTSSTVNIDFESLTAKTFTLTITVLDGSATDNGTISVTITDQNEAPSFNLATYSINANEGPAGSVVGDPGFVVTDVDSSAQKSYSIDCPTFDINNDTGVISYTTGYDADITGIAASVNCTVTVSDGQLTDTSSLVVAINNINDNTPTFGKPSYILYTAANAGVGDAIGTITATDGDTGTFGSLSYSLDQSQLSEEYFGVQSNGQIYVKSSLMTFVNGSTVVISTTAKDTGNLQDTAVVTIVIAAYSAEDIVTSYNYYRFIDDTRNVAWLTTLCVLLIALISLLSFFVYKYGNFPSTHHCCNRPKKLRSQDRWPTNNNRWGKPSPPPSPEVRPMSNIPDSDTNYISWEAWHTNDRYIT